MRVRQYESLNACFFSKIPGVCAFATEGNTESSRDFPVMKCCLQVSAKCPEVYDDIDGFNDHDYDDYDDYYYDYYDYHADNDDCDDCLLFV